MSKTIGVIGLGIIGSVWARHYDAAGVLAGAWNRTPQREFPRWLPDPVAVACAADVIQIVVADPPAVEGVLNGIILELRAGKTVIQSSTIDPDSSERFCRRVEGTGASYLEAPFVGSKAAAEARKNNFYLGGDFALAAEVEPFLSLISERRFQVGTGRQASALKLAINLNVALQMAALGESLAFARRSGISDDIYFDVLARNISYSPLVKMKEINLRTGEFPPQFSVKHMAKDMRLARLAAGSRALPQLAAVAEQLRLAEAAGFGGEDFSALAKLAGTGPA